MVLEALSLSESDALSIDEVSKMTGLTRSNAHRTLQTLASANPEHRVPYLAFQPDAVHDTPVLPIGEITTSYYLRLRVADQAGVLADITKILASHGVSIDALLQKEADEGESQTDLVALTHETKEKNMLAAIKEIQNLKTVAGEVVKIRLENLS